VLLPVPEESAEGVARSVLRKKRTLRGMRDSLSLRGGDICLAAVEVGRLSEGVGRLSRVWLARDFVFVVSLTAGLLCFEAKATLRGEGALPWVS